MSSVITGESPIINLADDLEDGEIDDDDEEEQHQQQLHLQQQQKSNNLTTGHSNDEVQFVGFERLADKLFPPPPHRDDDVVFLGMASESAAPTSSNNNKSKKPRPLEDDHAVSIENAIAKVLKKSGIEPPMPKMNNSSGSITTISNNSDADGSAANVNVAAGENSKAPAGIDATQQQQAPSRSSRRRKRKKEREREQKKDKEHQKRARCESMEDVEGVTAGSDELDMDEYEMMNVRGGSPPPGGSTATVGCTVGRYGNDWSEMGDGYDSPPDNYSSYESYSDEDQANAAATSAGLAQRRRQRREREKETRDGRKRRNRDRDRERERDRDIDRRHDGGGGGGGPVSGGAGKRNRRDSADDKPREPRKLELCKFYLKDCCAKRDKCSYMHKEFPCKYYYLGMECYAGEDCLFHHGEPLTEQLRNILLKHMETAPKEILGDFKRISREIALNQMTQRHEQLCQQYHMDNSWTTLASAGISRLQEQQHAAAKAAAQAANQAAAIAAVQHANMQQSNPSVVNATTLANTAIPSLLDMVINPPTNLHHGNSISSNISSNNINSDVKPEKKRKSRWAEKTANAKPLTVPNVANLPPTSAIVAPKPLSPHLDLLNLTQVLSAEHMTKLNKLGISNLEQMLQVPFGQLTEAGLSLPEIGEIQRMAEEANPDKQLQQAVTKKGLKASSSSSLEQPPVKAPAKSDQEARNVNAVGNSNSNSNSNNGFIMVDYTQYLKDAHVNFGGTDPLDDDREEDDEQLVIDDGNEEDEEESESDGKSKKLKRSSDEENKKLPQQKDDKDEKVEEEETPPMPSVFDLPTFMSNMLGQKQSQQQPATAVASGGATSLIVSEPARATSPTASENKSPDSGGLISKLLIGDKRDPEAHTAFYRDIVRNPFKAHSGDADADDSNDYYIPNDPQHSNSNSRSLTPTPTPEPGSQSPKSTLDEQPTPSPAQLLSAIESIYTRTSIYDYQPAKAAEEDARAHEAQRKRDRDIDMRLPFEPMKHYLPATEIDAAIFSHIPMRWHMQEVLVEPTSYAQLRQIASHKEQRELRDPRLRRILGLPELNEETGLGSSASGSASGSLSSGAAFSLKISADVASEHRESKTSNCISSPDAQQRDTTPSSPPPQLPVMNVTPLVAEAPAAAGIASTDPRRTDPRRDPRRAHLMNTSINSTTNNNSTNFSNKSSISNDCSRQILEIRNLLQGSNWYKNLGSNNKIMVNQQLALVFTELKKFHQQESSNKIFDVNFIVNNQTLQQIFAKLHIYIDDNGLVVQLPEELPGTVGAVGSAVSVPNLPPILPNMSQPPPNLAQLLCQPPPNVGRHQMLNLGMGMPQFNHPPPSQQRANSILGMPPNVANVNVMGVMNHNSNPFNPFSGGMNNINLNNMNNMNNMNNRNMGFNNGPGPGPTLINFNNGGNQAQGRHFARNRGGVGGNRNRN